MSGNATELLSPPAAASRDRWARIAIVSAQLPPKLDGIGDHAHRLAAALSGAGAEVGVFTSGGFSPTPIAGVRIFPCFATHPRKAIGGLAGAAEKFGPDWVVLEYNPFCFGNWGVNFHLAGALRRIVRGRTQPKLAVMVHEMFMPANSLRNAAMFAAQWWQFGRVTGLADITLFSTATWLEEYRWQHPGRIAAYMPVGSNFDVVAGDRKETRRRLGIAEDCVVLGVFGGSHPSRLPGHVAAAANELKNRGLNVRIVSVGGQAGDLKAIVGGVEIMDLGSLDASNVSEALQAMDVFCSPFIDGVSGRRGSFFAAMQHGAPIVTTRAYHTDGSFLRRDGECFFAPPAADKAAFVNAVGRLAKDAGLRALMGKAGRELFEAEYSSAALLRRWMGHLGVGVNVERD